MGAPALLARWDDWSKGNWGTAGASASAKGSWGGRNIALTRNGHVAPVSASRKLAFSNMKVGAIRGQHWAWGTDARCYFLQEIVATLDGLTLDGASGSYASTPDNAVYNVSGEISMIARIKLPDWTPASAPVIYSHWTDGSNKRSWLVRITTAGAIQLFASPDGTIGASFSFQSSNLGFVDGSTRWIGLTYNTNNGALTFYKAPDSLEPPPRWTGWTQVSTHVAPVSALFDTDATVEIGASEGGTLGRMTGTFYRGAIFANGVPIATPDFTISSLPLAIAGSSTYTDSTAKVWTIHGGAAIAGDSPAGSYQLRRFLVPLDDLLAPIVIENVGAPIPAPTRIPDWFESGGKLYMTSWSDASYIIDPDAVTITKLTGGSGDAPGGRTICVYGERMMIAGIDDTRFGTAKGNRVVYSDAADFTSWPDDNFFDAGADPSEIGGLYNMSDVLVIIFADQQIWTYRGVPGGAASLRRQYGFHSGAGGTEAFSPRDATVDPSQTRIWLYDHSSRSLARFSGTQYARVPGYGVTTITRAEAGSVSGGAIAIGGPDEILVDQVPMPRVEGESASGDNLELLRTNGVVSLIERAVLIGS